MVTPDHVDVDVRDDRLPSHGGVVGEEFGSEKSRLFRGVPDDEDGAGRALRFGQMGEGLYIEDDKTTSQLGSSWGAQWDMRSQFTGYAWAARQSGLPIAGIIVRGISILKTKKFI